MFYHPSQESDLLNFSSRRKQMANKVASVALHKKTTTPINKHISSRKKKLKNVLDYMRLDAYMFSPLVHPPKHSVTFSDEFSGEEPFEQSTTKGKKSFKDVNAYMKCDCHMYAPLLVESGTDHDHSPCTVNSGNDTVGDAIERAENPDDDAKKSHVVAVKQFTMHRQEIVKRVVHQNGPSSIAPGKVRSKRQLRKRLPR